MKILHWRELILLIHHVIIRYKNRVQHVLLFMLLIYEYVAYSENLIPNHI